MTLLAEGNAHRIIHNASGVRIPLENASRVEFVSYVATGDQVLTFTQQTGAAGTPANYDVGDYWKSEPAKDNPESVDAPGGNVITHADGTKSVVLVDVRGRSLGRDSSDVDYDSITCTAGTGTLLAIVYGLAHGGDPAEVPPIVE